MQHANRRCAAWLLAVALELGGCGPRARQVSGLAVNAHDSIALTDQDVRTLAALARSVGLEDPRSVETRYTRYPSPCPTAVLKGPATQVRPQHFVQDRLIAKRTTWSWCYDYPDGGERRTLKGWDSAAGLLEQDRWIRVERGARHLRVERSEDISDEEAVLIGEAMLRRTLRFAPTLSLEGRRRAGSAYREARRRKRLFIREENMELVGRREPELAQTRMLSVSAPGLWGTSLVVQVEHGRVVVHSWGAWIV